MANFTANAQILKHSVKAWWLTICLLASLAAMAQPRQAIRSMEYARGAIQNGNKKEAISYLKEAISLYPEYTEARYLLGDIYFQDRDYASALEQYDTIVQQSNSGEYVALYKKANCLYFSYRFEEAIPVIDAYLAHPRASQDGMNNARRWRASSVFGIEAMKHPVPFAPENLGKNINTRHMEYFPSITADGKQLIFTRNEPVNRVYQEDFYSSTMENGVWGLGQVLPSPVNTPDNEGALCISANGKVIFFTGCNRENGYGSCDLYITTLQNGGWMKPVNLGPPINTEAWESQPALSPDGNTVIFCSNRPGGLGGKDLWISHYQGKGVWTEPENLGDSINTSGDEFSPFLYWDERTLFFASDGHPGLGMLDLFVSTKGADGKWGKPKNLGYPINTVFEDNGLIIAPDGRTAYYANENLEGGFGKLDIYSFSLPEQLAPPPITYLDIRVVDAETGKPVESTLQLTELGSNLLLKDNRNAQGQWILCLTAGSNYGVFVSAEGYLFHSENVALNEARDREDPRILEIRLQPIKTGEKIVLRNVFFDTDSKTLKPESKAELELLYKLMVQNPNMKLEIAGHTDNQGSVDHNQRLSQMRAEEVMNHLIKLGIAPQRMKAVGYGATQPMANNETEQGRAQNRRTEAKVIE